MSGFIFRRQFAIEWGHCDPAGIIFNARFFEFFDRSAWLTVEAALDIAPGGLFAAYGIAGLPPADAETKFLSPAKFGDRAQIESQIVESGGAHFKLVHRMSVDGRAVAEGTETRVWSARDLAAPYGLRAEAIPDAALARFRRAA